MADNSSKPTSDVATSAAPAEQGDARTPDLLADIRPGGFVDQILGQADRTALTDEAMTLHDKLRKDVVSMQEAEKDPRTRLDSGYSVIQPAQLPWYFVHKETQWYRADPVLRYCLQCRWQIDDSEDKILDAAWSAYIRVPDEYDQLLGDFIPANFRTAARQQASEIRFDRNANRTAADDWPIYMSRLKERRVKKLLGITTGVPALDSALRGLRGLTYLGGGPGVGKTTLALFMAASALRKHRKLAVLFYSMDMPKTVVYDRLFCMEAAMTYADLVGELNANKTQQLEEAADRLRADVLPRLRIIERITPAKKESVAQAIQNDIDDLKMNALGVFTIVDYFQLLPISGKTDTSIDADFDRVRTLQQIQEWSRSNVYPEGNPILVISEVRKGESGRTELNTPDLMGSARLGFSAETVLLLEPSDEDTSADVAQVRLNIAKARDGAVRSKIDLLFEHTRYRFREAPARKIAKPAKKPPPTKSNKPTIDPLAGLEDTK